MGSSSQPDTPELQFPSVFPPDEWVALQPPVRVARREPKLRYIVLFALTVVTTTLVGGWMHWASFVQGFSSAPFTESAWSLALHGLWYSASILGILGAHEFGHYYACRYYGVDCSLPYFLPVPPPFFTGTLGAVIRIRQPIPGKRALFDIGIAGPIAGFVVAVPLLLIGMHLSTVVRIPSNFQGDVYELGEPLLFKAASWLTFGHVADGYTVNMHPMAFASWFGLLATALNLFPIGQLDGGHICYAVLGRKSTAITLLMVACLIGLTFVSASWIVWTVLTVGMLIAFGPRHPSTFDEQIPLDAPRLWLAGFALLMFVLCFTPAPIQAGAILGR